MKIIRNRIATAVAGGVAAVWLTLGVVAAAAPVKADYPAKVGKGEGQLNLVAWEGYAQDEWVKPFEKQTGCMVHRKYAGSSDEMVALMRQGGGGEYDLVSASGDASLRLIYGGDVQPVNVKLIPAWQDFLPQLKSPPNNTVNGLHYGVSYEWGPNVLLYNTKKVSPKPTSWDAIYSDAHKGRITVPDNPIQIADAALYLKAHKPNLGIKDPYELTQKQLAAAVDLLQKQRPLIKKYWAQASDEIELFKNGDAVVGAAWPYMTNALQKDGVPVADTIPKEGATGWSDTWMLSAHAKHPNCAYKWMQYVSTPKVQAEQAIYFGETPANKQACSAMDKIQDGACHKFHLDAPSSYFDQIYFWKTPRTQCADGQRDCTSYRDWQRAWQRVKG
ncbi:ABC transporter substrate-binding protein [Salinisphaera sp. LB1]|uniref:ABC transporter substrate-binding protein n=1 Tax=Salinisphaera sp. LB1 TaxID=2183911 RepID=UPI000D705B3A|nr:ABC transporter substrate-binding protein [Salinisphaera sp. LB1]